MKHKWAEHVLLLSMLLLQFGWLHLAKFWSEFIGYNGTCRNYRKRFLVTLNKKRTIFVLAKCYAISFAPLDIYGSLILYHFLGFMFGDVTILSLKLVELWRFTPRIVFEFRGYRLVAPSRFTTFGNSLFLRFSRIKIA